MKEFVLGLIVAALVGSAVGQTYGSWWYVPDIDRITDENRSYVYTEGTDRYRGRSPLLALRCNLASFHTGIEVFVYSPQALSDPEVVSVTYRVDRREPHTWFWGMGTSGDAAFMNVFDVWGFLVESVQGSEVAIRIHDRSGDITYVFPLRGLSAALAALGCYTGPPL